jgi:hypothetical protein
MYKLEPINVARLNNLEFGQHIKSLIENSIECQTEHHFATDTALEAMFLQLQSASNTYNSALMQVMKSDHTSQIVHADRLRDLAVTQLMRYLSVFEYSSVDTELSAFESLNTLVREFHNLQRWNLEEETNGIDTLVIDLTNEKYQPKTVLLRMNPYVTQLMQTNTAFKEVFRARIQESASKEVFDVKKLRFELKTYYNNWINYVLAMSKATETPTYTQHLKVINTIRKEYADLLAKRK